MKQDVPEQDLHSMLDVLLYAYTVQAVRPACHWWRCPRVFAWFRVRMVWSLVKPPATAGPLSRIGDYLLAAHGPELLRRIRRRPTFPHERAATRGPPDPLFHRRRARVFQRRRLAGCPCRPKRGSVEPGAGCGHVPGDSGLLAFLV